MDPLGKENRVQLEAVQWLPLAFCTGTSWFTPANERAPARQKRPLQQSAMAIKKISVDRTKKKKKQKKKRKQTPPANRMLITGWRPPMPPPTVESKIRRTFNNTTANKKKEANAAKHRTSSVDWPPNATALIAYQSFGSLSLSSSSLSVGVFATDGSPTKTSS